MSNQRHLTFEERVTIEQELLRNTSFKDIALILDKDATTISKEIRKHRIEKPGQSIHVSYNQCAKKYACQRKDFSSRKKLESHSNEQLSSFYLLFLITLFKNFYHRHHETFHYY